uniref:Uncharacterized protein n=2 Tax=Octopus bimaculoides TaxID=37653 RepID=A0A0L8G8B1_OCTBM
MVQRRNDNYLDTNWSNVSSTSQPNRMIPAAGVTPPGKRSLDTAPETVTLVKRHRIKTEDGNYVTVTLNEDTASVPDLATRRREEKEKSNQEPVGVIDLTDDDDPKMKSTNGILPASNSNMMPTSDVSVAVEVSETPIDMEVTAMEVTRNRSSASANEVVSVLPSANRALNEDDGIKIISVNSVASLPTQAAAADSVVSAAQPQNNASPAAVTPAAAASPPSSSASRLASEPAVSEDGEEENLDCVKKRLNELRENVKRLIEIIVPNIDFGEHKIDDVVVEMIRINSQVNS